MAVIQTSDQQFSATVGAGGLVLVDFWAPWCGPCKVIAPILEELDRHAAEQGVPLTIAKMNVDDNPDTAAQFGIRSIPTLKLFKDGAEVDTVVGTRPLADLIEFVSSHA